MPVEAQARVWKPHSAARAAATATTRSLNESVGLRESSLTQSRSRPRRAASRGASTSGETADPQATRRTARERQELGEAPQVGLPGIEPIATEARAKRRQVIAGLQRPEAAAADEDRPLRGGFAAGATAQAREAGLERRQAEAASCLR